MRQEPSNAIVVPVTASQTIAARNCVVTAVTLNPAAAACTVSLYDPPPNTATTTNATLRVTLVAPASVSSAVLPLSSSIEFANGCIAVVTGVGATSTVAWATI